MPEFLELISPAEGLDRLLRQINYRLDPEVLPTINSLDRISYDPIYAPHPLPTFNRSTVDGYAVRARDTHGASDTQPAYLKVIGEIKMGAPVEIDLEMGCCALIHTGGMLPASANAVAMLEHTQVVGQDEIEIFRALAEGENIILIGEDVTPGFEVIPGGKRIGPAEIGGLAALGINQLTVCRQPRVAIISSGDEVVAPDKIINPGQVRDVNTYMLQALITRCGGIPISYGILPDHLELLTRVAQKALDACDMVIFTAGSSASTRDFTVDSVNSLGKPGVLVHGINIRPGKPTILAACKSSTSAFPKPVIGLPGNPVSALVIAGLFVKPVIQQLLGITPREVQPYVVAQISINLASQAGREDWIPVRLNRRGDTWIAEPVFGKSNLIFTLVRSDGLICIPQDANGLEAGTTVEVFLL